MFEYYHWIDNNWIYAFKWPLTIINAAHVPPKLVKSLVFVRHGYLCVWWMTFLITTSRVHALWRPFHYTLSTMLKRWFMNCGKIKVIQCVLGTFVSSFVRATVHWVVLGGIKRENHWVIKLQEAVYNPVPSEPQSHPNWLQLPSMYVYVVVLARSESALVYNHQGFYRLLARASSRVSATVPR